MARNVTYLLFDTATGYVTERFSVPPERFPPAEIPSGRRIVVPADGKVPTWGARLDLRKARHAINHVSSVEDVLAPSSREQAMSESHGFEVRRQEAIANLDRVFTRRFEQVAGPLAALHAEKRRQAEAGDGPLVADEADRLAILANAAAQGETVAAIERDRRERKARLRAATTDDEIKAALAASDDPKEAFQ